ncbi:MAG: SemiSWEET family transporter [Thermodesulfobacteriota bacterium]
MSFVGVSMALAGIPQAGRIYKRRSSEDISLVFWLIVFHGQAWFFYYGFTIKSASLVITNGVCLVLTTVIIALTLRFRKRIFLVKEKL